MFLDLLHTEDQTPPTSKDCLRHGLRLGTFATTSSLELPGTPIGAPGKLSLAEHI